jgi:hypothetical protein
MRSSFCSAVRGGGTNFADTCHICKSSDRIFWHILNVILTYSATSLIVRCRSAHMISCTRATVSSLWEVDGLPGWGSSKIGVHFCHGNTTQISSIESGRTLQKLLPAFHNFQHQFSPDGNINRSTHTAAVPIHHKM